MFRRILLLIIFLSWPPQVTENTCVLHLESPKYSRLARFARAQGDVPVEVRISRDGRVVSATALSGLPILQDAAVTNVRKWVFSSGAERTLQILYQFKLQGAAADFDIPEISYDLPNKILIVASPPPPNLGE